MTKLLPHSDDRSSNISERRRLEVFSNPNDRVHGTATGYVYGCRCDRCRSARSVANRAQAARRKAGYRTSVLSAQGGGPVMSAQRLFLEHVHSVGQPRLGDIGEPVMADLLPHSVHGTGKITEAHRREIFADPGHRFHGTLTAYTYGCRCDPCGAARRAYDQARKAGA